MSSAAKEDSSSSSEPTTQQPAPLSFPYECQVDLTFPTPRHAQQTLQVMQVDQEIGDRVVKTFTLMETGVVRVHFRATEARMLRVSVSSFYDYLTVALKCFQEFDDSLLGGCDESNNSAAAAATTNG